MAASWSPDSASLVTSAADRTVKLCRSKSMYYRCCCTDAPLGDVELRRAVSTWTLGETLEHQQVGNAWTEGDDIVSLSLGGDLSVFDKRVGDKPTRVLQVTNIHATVWHIIHRSPDRHPLNPSQPLHRLPIPAPLLQAWQMVAFSHSLDPTTPTPMGRGTRISSPASPLLQTERCIRLVSMIKFERLVQTERASCMFYTQR